MHPVSSGTKSNKHTAMDTKTYVEMPPHSRCNVNGTYYEIISCRTITKKIAEYLLDSKQFENGIDRELLKRSGIEDTSDWWYNSVDDLIMIKGRTGRYYIKKRREINNLTLGNAYQVACDNYMVISQYVERTKRMM